ncbi:hypothetical protein, partial [Gelidibacter salicanalis]|uniref:hypothetical protein n=1 Tax=Gelidibacter salicanalis TaxID=291193 RepID=UPI001F1DD643
ILPASLATSEEHLLLEGVGKVEELLDFVKLSLHGVLLEVDKGIFFESLVSGQLLPRLARDLVTFRVDGSLSIFC